MQFEKAAAELGAKGIKRAYVIPDGNEASARVIIAGYPEFHGAISPLGYSDVEDDCCESVYAFFVFTDK